MPFYNNMSSWEICTYIIRCISISHCVTFPPLVDRCVTWTNRYPYLRNCLGLPCCECQYLEDRNMGSLIRLIKLFYRKFLLTMIAKSMVTIHFILHKQSLLYQCDICLPSPTLSQTIKMYIRNDRATISDDLLSGWSESNIVISSWTVNHQSSLWLVTLGACLTSICYKRNCIHTLFLLQPNNKASTH